MKRGYSGKSSVTVREGEWLLVDNLVWEGKWGSLDFLLVARDCGKLADELIGSGNYEVDVYRGRDSVEVVIGCYPTYAATLTVGRRHPYKGLDELHKELQELLNQEKAAEGARVLLGVRA